MGQAAYDGAANMANSAAETLGFKENKDKWFVWCSLYFKSNIFGVSLNLFFIKIKNNLWQEVSNQ